MKASLNSVCSSVCHRAPTHNSLNAAFISAMVWSRSFLLGGDPGGVRGDDSRGIPGAERGDDDRGGIAGGEPGGTHVGVLSGDSLSKEKLLSSPLGNW